MKINLTLLGEIMSKGGLQGRGGFVSGPTFIVHTPSDKPFTPDDLAEIASKEALPDSILIMSRYQLELTFVYRKVQAVILEYGGKVSHGATIAREEGYPLVVVPSILKLAEEGNVIGVSTQGEIAIVDLWSE